MRLNRISANYPAIPKINPVNGFFGEDTENAVLTFQRVFDLIPDGIVGKATWYKIQFVYNAVKKLNELESEGLRLEDVSKQFPGVLSLGDTGENVRIIQYFLSAVSFFNSAVPDPGTSGVYDEATRNAVIAFQAFSGLPQTGVTDDATWNLLYDDYLGDIRSLTSEQIGSAVIPFPGVFLQLGDTGENITVLQNLINTAADVYNTIPPIPVTGVFDENTRDAVFAAETLFGLPVDGIVGPLLWDTLADIESDIRSGEYRNPGQFSGNPLSVS
jgi:peptidoglycan hydrolase-like protein with peptidoglycan-binding domain